MTQSERPHGGPPLRQTSHGLPPDFIWTQPSLSQVLDPGNINCLYLSHRLIIFPSSGIAQFTLVFRNE